MSRWLSLSTHFLRDEKIETLGERHGPGGPLVVMQLLINAKENTDEAGTAWGSFSLLAKRTKVKTDEAFKIVSSAVEVGLVEARCLTSDQYILEFPKWQKWQSGNRGMPKKSAADKGVDGGVTGVRKRSRDRDFKSDYRNYKEYLKSPEWAEVKQRYRKSKLPQKCQVCKTSENLQMHHKTYARLYNERLTDLCWLCADCHDWVHRFIKQKDNKSRHNERTAVKTLRKRYERRGKRD